ncbi:sensor histidine kinase [Segetibacter sp. 3557_3]|uniref:hybrid sensor histidine kinase/response regulator n=1 Tax=Segetibacter sp. 3557_3 TaxID=2547429 RepID=UPI00105868CF|nr:hybrid sensor histidine kinase/response regulator [Segetibacter sp. 3557_3]TDH28588.1 sensor histidine kinase [Segetibacter sp. 3557_3]
MSPPEKIQLHLERYHQRSNYKYGRAERYEVPTFFDRKRVEEEMQKSRLSAEESAKLKSDFVANMSHELRTPLGTILGFSDLLKKTALTAQQQEYLEAINTSGRNLLSIINNILDLSKLDAGKFVVDNVSFDLAELLHGIRLMFGNEAKQKGLRFNLLLDSAINYPVLGDPTRMTQILLNLIGNAIKFTETGGVTVSCIGAEEENDSVILNFSVEDSGIGIDELQLETIFERFTQADSNTTRKYGGTGLGLSITRQLIGLMGGAISVKSCRGQGTTFEFTIPVTRANAAVTVQADMEGQQLHFTTPKRILLVEDTLLNQKLTSIILQNNGFIVDVAENGRQAIDILRGEQYDLILMDIQMPEMDGYEATCYIRDTMKIAIPIIAMTAHALAGEREKCFQQGINDYLAKPFSESDLLFKLSLWLVEKRSSEAVNPEDSPVAIIDLGFLKKQTRNNAAVMSDLIRIFREENPKDISKLSVAIARSDYTTIYKTVHSLKSETSMFGLRPLVSHDLTSIEELARAGGDIEEVKKCFSRVEQVCKQAVEELALLQP